MKILNLYAGIGGNRKLWGDEHQITAVENNEEIANIYKHFFPNDDVVIADAHQYLLEHYKEFDFIWSSPPCPTHSKFRFMTTKMKNPKYSRPILYPDMKLYQEIIFLKHYFEGKFVVENVNPYYTPLIKPSFKISRHLFWSNFDVEEIKIKGDNMIKKHFNNLWEKRGFDLSKFKIGSRKDVILRNCVDSEIGLHILNSIKQKMVLT